MPRTARAIEAGTVYHVLNRGNGGMRLLHKPADYDAFERVLMEGMERYPVELFRQTHCERDSWSGRQTGGGAGCGDDRIVGKV